MKIIKTCEVCGNKKLISVLNLGEHPLCDDLKKIGDLSDCDKFKINIKFCQNCLTAHQEFQVEKQKLFPASYHYRSRFTNDVLDGMRDLLSSTIKNFGNLNNKIVLDVGCNDGSLLDFFHQSGAITIGVEPTGAYSDINLEKHIAYNEYFTPELVKKITREHGYPEIVTFTNVFAHIDNFNELIDSLKILINKKDILIIIENHYLGSVLKSNQFDTFYHEHPRTYSYESFRVIASRLGLNLVYAEFPGRYGGNIRVFLSNNLNYLSHQAPKETEFLKSFELVGSKISLWKKNKIDKIQTLLKKYGKLTAKAFPGRAAILISLLNLDENTIMAVYEKPGSIKIGNYIPGTKIPILSDNDMKIENIECIINLAWHIAPEINSYLRGLGYSNELINIVDRFDFD